MAARRCHGLRQGPQRGLSGRLVALPGVRQLSILRKRGIAGEGLIDDDGNYSTSKREAGMKITVIGANGQLGHDVVRAFAVQGDEVQSFNHQDVELSSTDSVVACLRSAQPEVV